LRRIALNHRLKMHHVIHRELHEDYRKRYYCAAYLFRRRFNFHISIS